MEPIFELNYCLYTILPCPKVLNCLRVRKEYQRCSLLRYVMFTSRGTFTCWYSDKATGWTVRSWNPCMGKRFSSFHKTSRRVWGPHSPTSYSVFTEILVHRAKRWDVQLITHLYPVPRLMHGTMQLLLYTPSWRAKGKLYHYIYL